MTIPAARLRADRVDSLFASFDHSHSPGVAVGVAIDGNPVYRKAFGLAQLEPSTAILPTTRMRIASVTKHFTCLAYLLLCEDGRASIADPLQKHLPELAATTYPVTMRQVMAHTSGLRDACDWFFYDTRKRSSSTDVLRCYQHIADRNAVPDQSWRYNDGAYLLLGLAIERIYDQPLEEVFRSRIFAPLGMRDTLLSRWDTQAVPDSADTYIRGSDGVFTRTFRFTEGVGQGGLLSSIDDMLRWLAHMDTPVVGTRETWQLIKSPQHLANGTSTGYGFGLISSRYHDVETLWHSGMVMGGKSQMLKVPAANLDIVVIANRHDVSAVELANSVLEACLPGLCKEAVRTATPVNGTFRSVSSDRLVRLFAKGPLQIVSVDGIDLAFSRPTDEAKVLRPVADSAYRMQSVVLVDSVTNPAEIDFCDYGNSERLIAVSAATPARLGEIPGRFRSGFAGTEAVISHDRPGLSLRTVGPFGSTEYQLQHLVDQVWRARGGGAPALGGILSFNSTADEFRLTTNANRAVVFSRTVG